MVHGLWALFGFCLLLENFASKGRDAHGAYFGQVGLFWTGGLILAKVGHGSLLTHFGFIFGA